MVGSGPVGDPAGPSGLPVGDLPGGDPRAAAPPTLDLLPPSVVLAVGAHPDDIEFGCGATLAKWASAGCRLHHLVLTDGSKGTWDPDADQHRLVTERQAECRAAASVIDGPGRSGADGDDRVLFLGQVDGELENNREVRRAIARVVRQLRPDVVVGHDPWRRYRLHPDHRIAGFALLDALVAARDPHFFPEIELGPHRPEALLLFEADLPNHVEDVSGFESQKIEALLCHRSQFESTMGIRPNDDTSPAADDGYTSFAAKVRHQLVAHGSLADLPSGEAFHLITAR
ncbi:MAG TPA: PIG-L deacetylase family protein [Acidimicrobiales bacterium]|nr:PIG-L deacetylase family protein [Acidimicrobiales bacterium]